MLHKRWVCSALRRALLFALAMVLCCQSQLHAGSPYAVETVVAGAGYILDGLPSIGARLLKPSKIAVDADGTLYVVDQNEVRKVGLDGTLTTVAGSRASLPFGETLPSLPKLAKNAAFDGITGIAVGPNHAIYLSDEARWSIERITELGAIESIAGEGSQRRVVPTEDESDAFKNGVPARGSYLPAPRGLAVKKDGTIFVAVGRPSTGGGDTPFFAYPSGIREITPDGLIHTVAGGHICNSQTAGDTTLQQCVSATSLTLDYAERLLFIDHRNLVRFIDFSGKISTINDALEPINGLTYGSLLEEPIVATADIPAIFAVHEDSTGFGGPASVLAAPNGDALNAKHFPLVASLDVAADSQGNIYVLDNRVIWRFSWPSDASIVAGSLDDGDGDKAINAILNDPSKVLVTSRSEVYIDDERWQYPTLTNRTRRIDRHGNIATAPMSTFHAFPIGVDTTGGVFYVEGDRVFHVDTLGTTLVAGNGGVGYSGDGLKASAAALSNPTAVAADRFGNVYISDTGNCRVRKVSAGSGMITTVAGNGVCGFSGDGGLATAASIRPRYMGIDNGENIYIFSDEHDGQVSDKPEVRLRRIDARTHLITTMYRHVTQLTNEAFNLGDLAFAVSGSGTTYAVTDFIRDTLVCIDPQGQSREVLASSASPESRTAPQPVAAPTSIAVGPAGEVYALYSSSGELSKISLLDGGPPCR